jgi:hypothetical protein
MSFMEVPYRVDPNVIEVDHCGFSIGSKKFRHVTYPINEQHSMTSNALYTLKVIPTAMVMAMVFSVVGCGGESAPTPAPAASGGGEDSTPKAPPQKKGGVMVESEDNTPARLKGRDN